MSIYHSLQNLLKDCLYGIHDTMHVSWAWSIILLTIGVRLLIMPLTIKQTRSMLVMQRLQPYLTQLKKRYKDDRQELQRKQMEFFRDNKVNPLASCFPMLLQAPVFIILVTVLRHFSSHPPKSDADFSFLFHHVHDITVHVSKGGPWGIALIIFYLATQLFSTYVMSTSPDPKQRKLMLLMPFAFVLFIVNFPIGLLLYSITTNLWTVAQFGLIVKFLHPRPEIVLPEDSKGRKQVVVPKADKVAARKASAAGGKGKASAAATRNRQDEVATTSKAKQNTARHSGRRNKRRR